MEPIYSTPEPNAPITLYEGDFEIEHGDDHVKCHAPVRFEWLPSPAITAYVEDVYVGDVNAVLKLPRRQPAIIGILDATWGSSCSFKARLNDQSGITFDNGHPLRYVDFSFVNLMRLVMQHSIEVEFVGWKFTLKPIEGLDKLMKAANRVGGYIITYSARLERADGSLFTSAEAKDALDGLGLFFSLAQGSWTSPILPIGFDAQGKQAWHHWVAPRITPWESFFGWLNDMNYVVQSIEDSLRGFWAKWHDPIWHNSGVPSSLPPLKLIIHWFISANLHEGATEGALVLAQNGLELMSWVRLVEEEGRNSTRFDKKSTAVKVEQLLQFMGAPLDLPTNFKELGQAAQVMTDNARLLNDARPVDTSGNKVGREVPEWSNGPQSIVELRNTIVHPRRHNDIANIEVLARWQALHLALWYLELSLLHLFGYNGFYNNRMGMFQGISERFKKVPWG